MNRSTTFSGQRCVRAPCACAMIMPYHHAIPCTVIMPYHHAMPCYACFARPCYAMPCHDLLHNLQWTEVCAPCACMCDAQHCTIIHAAVPVPCRQEHVIAMAMANAMSCHFMIRSTTSSGQRCVGHMCMMCDALRCTVIQLCPCHRSMS